MSSGQHMGTPMALMCAMSGMSHRITLLPARTPLRKFRTSSLMVIDIARTLPAGDCPQDAVGNDVVHDLSLLP